MTILPFSFLPEKIIDKLMIWLCWKKIIDKSLLWPWAMGNCKNFSWQLYCMAVTIINKFLIWLCTSKFHWQSYCTASKIIDNLDIQLFAPLTIVLYGCQYQLTIVPDVINWLQCNFKIRPLYLLPFDDFFFDLFWPSRTIVNWY